MTRTRRSDIWVSWLLLAFSLVPVLAGGARLAGLASRTTAPADIRFLASPLPVVIHVVAASIYALLGAFQFSTDFRLRWPRWHRSAGAVALGCGFLVASTGVWMAAFYPIPASLQGPILCWSRLLVGLGMLVALASGLLAIRQRQLARHEAWMIRAYALAQGAGTQVILFLPAMLVSGPLFGLQRDLLMSAAWLLNLALGEAVIRRRATSAQLRLGVNRSRAAV
jgi:hypothetical protein